MMKSNLCVLCKHARNDRTCTAYPNGIPDSIFFDGENHFESRGDDNGIIFDPKNEKAEEAALALGYVPAEELVGV